MKNKVKIVLLIISLMLVLGCQEQAVIEEANGEIKTSEPVNKETEIPTTNWDQEEVRIVAYGPEGFSIEETTASVGDSLTFVNENSKERDITITLQKDGSRTFINAEVIKLGEEYSLSIEEPGTYEFWTLGFPPKGKIIIK